MARLIHMEPASYCHRLFTTRHHSGLTHIDTISRQNINDTCTVKTGLIASVKSIGRVRDGHILFYVQLIVLQTKDYKGDPSRKKRNLSELLSKIMKTGTKQAQADTVRSFQNGSLVR